MTALDLLIHGANSLLMLIEIIVILHPMYFLHAVYTLALGVIYTIFTLIYYFAGGVNAHGDRYIYDILNWENGLRATIISIVVIILAVIMHSFACVLQICRVRFHRFITNSQRTYNVSFT